ncbi:nucleotidyltransferase family protein [Desulfobotulus sp.]|jgi:mannose-1-phosphate guanylyltransferase|uniref:nucleotidyltransferase family protein n=1 Tax=Desulfobotulus sp. TaxID=1940337 RepID=UPI002A35D36B|nr:nucleotidyltransferase family protein [Desulfobotulus sp.]MDY0161819.1 nucleotidyltransferase family protein [Desulfobotulus sp.]
MKAFLLAAGLGTRLKPLTDHSPKCLAPIAGTPLMAIWLDHLHTCGVREILINTHHLAEKVEAFVRAWPQQNLRIRTVHEPELLGSAGTLLQNEAFVEGEKNFLIVYADNLCNFDLRRLARAHGENRKKGGLLTMALFTAPCPSACGIAVLNAQGLVTDFAEKPENPLSSLANAGIYAAGPEIFTSLRSHASHRPYDFGLHVLPHMTGKMYGLPMEGYLRDIGTPDALAAAQREWPLASRRSHGL